MRLKRISNSEQMDEKNGNGLYNSQRNFVTQKNRDRHIPFGIQNKKKGKRVSNGM